MKLLENEKRDISIVRLTRSHWVDNGSIHKKVSIRVLKRKSKGYQILHEDSREIGAEEAFPRIVNLEECEDGVYEVITCNEQRDWETGYIDDYDYKLVKVDGENNAK